MGTTKGAPRAMATVCTCRNRKLGSKKRHDKDCPQKKSRPAKEGSLPKQPFYADIEEFRHFLAAQKESWRARRAAEADSAPAQQAEPKTLCNKRKLADEELDELNAAENRAEAEMRETLCEKAASTESDDPDDENSPDLCREYVTVGNSHDLADFILKMIEAETPDPDDMDEILKLLRHKDLAGDALVDRFFEFFECDDYVDTFVDALFEPEPLVEPERGEYACAWCNVAPYVGIDMVSCDRCRYIACLECAGAEGTEQDDAFYCSECIKDLERFESDPEDGYGEVGASSDDDDDDDCDTDDSEAAFRADCLELKQAGDEDGLVAAEKKRAKELKKREQHLFKPSDSDDSDDEAVVRRARDDMGKGKRRLNALVDRNAAMLITSEDEEVYLEGELEARRAKRLRKESQVSQTVCGDDNDDDDDTEEEQEEGKEARA